VKHGAHGDLVATEDRSETLLVTPADRLAEAHGFLNLRELRCSGRIGCDHDHCSRTLANRSTDNVRTGDRELSAAGTGEQTFDPAIRRDHDLISEHVHGAFDLVLEDFREASAERLLRALFRGVHVSSAAEPRVGKIDGESPVGRVENDTNEGVREVALGATRALTARTGLFALLTPLVVLFRLGHHVLLLLLY
jgi:hypothetical protein